MASEGTAWSASSWSRCGSAWTSSTHQDRVTAPTVLGMAQAAPCMLEPSGGHGQLGGASTVL